MKDSGLTFEQCCDIIGDAFAFVEKSGATTRDELLPLLENHNTHLLMMECIQLTEQFLGNQKHKRTGDDIS